MAYRNYRSGYRGASRGSGGYSTRRRRSTYSGYRKYRTSYTRASGAKRYGAKRGSTRMAASMKYGDAMTASFCTIAFPLFHLGLLASNNYLEVPLSGLVDSVLQVAGKTSVYVTGFRLEANVSHSGRLRCFAQSVQTGVSDGEPEVAFRSSSMQGEFVPEGKTLMKMDSPRLQKLMAPLYTRLGIDGTLFGADVKAGAPCRPSVEFRKDKGKRQIGKYGRVEAELGRVATAVSAATMMETEEISVYVPVGSVYTMDTDRRDVLLLGLRAKTVLDLPRQPVEKDGVDPSRIGLLENVRVTVYLRQKMT